MTAIWTGCPKLSLVAMWRHTGSDEWFPDRYLKTIELPPPSWFSDFGWLSRKRKTKTKTKLQLKGESGDRRYGTTQGRGRRLLKFSYQDYPRKCDVTSGLNCVARLVSQSEKMAFHTEDRNMLEAHFFDFLSKTFGEREQLSIVLKENNGEPSVIEWRI